MVDKVKKKTELNKSPTAVLQPSWKRKSGNINFPKEKTMCMTRHCHRLLLIKKIEFNSKTMQDVVLKLLKYYEDNHYRNNHD